MKRSAPSLPRQPGLPPSDIAADDQDSQEARGRLLVVDGHEDLSLGALGEGRNYLTSAHTIRALETEAGYDNPNGICMLGLSDWLRGSR